MPLAERWQTGARSIGAKPRRRTFGRLQFAATTCSLGAAPKRTYLPRNEDTKAPAANLIAFHDGGIDALVLGDGSTPDGDDCPRALLPCRIPPNGQRESAVSVRFSACARDKSRQQSRCCGSRSVAPPRDRECQAAAQEVVPPTDDGTSGRPRCKRGNAAEVAGPARSRAPRDIMHANSIASNFNR